MNLFKKNKKAPALLINKRFRNKTFVGVTQNSFIRRLRCNKRALSPVVSSMVLVAVVIVLGFSTLAYAHTISDDYRDQYQENVSTDISKLRETLTFEYVYFNNGHILIYFMNSGSISFEVNMVSLSTLPEAIEPNITYLSGGLASNKTLAIGEQRLIDLPISIVSGQYTIKITTIRGSSFEYSFMV